jgi:hypothetical protein
MLAQQAVEESLHRNAACDQQGLVPVMAVQPVVLRQMRRQGHGSLVTGTGQMKESLATVGQLLFHSVDLARRHHSAVQREQLSAIHRFTLIQRAITGVRKRGWIIATHAHWRCANSSKTESPLGEIP